MRTGAIFARGSCRALNWMALVGVVFALGAGSAAAQVTIKAPKTVDEAGRLRITVTAKVSVAAGADATTVTVTATVSSGEGDDSKLLTVAEGDADYSTVTAAEIRVPANTHATEAAEHDELTGTIIVQTLPDLDAEDEAIVVTVTNGDITHDSDVTDEGAGVDLTVGEDDSVDVTINDTDEQVFEWDEPDKPKEGSDIVVKLTADPAPVNLTHSVPLSIDAAGYTLQETTASLAEGAPTATITIDPPDSDGDRDDDEITLRALKAGTTSDLIDPLTIDVADIHKLPADDKITAQAFQDDGKGKKTKNEAMSVMEGGDPVHVTITVDRGDDNYPSGEKLKVEVLAADSAQGLDYRVDKDEFDLPAEKGEQSMDIKLWARDDDDVGEEELVLNLVVSGADDDNGPGQSMGMFSIAIEDVTTPLVWVKDGAYDAIKAQRGEDDEPLNPGDSFSVMTSDLFGHAETVNVSYGTAVEGGSVSASSSGDSVMVTATEAGSSKVTVTATATPMSDSLIITQDRKNVAQVAFPVDVVLTDLSVTVTADPMEIMEGGMSTITATANRMVSASDDGVEITLDVVGDGMLSADSIMIAPGMMSGSATLTATEDDDDYMDETVTVVAAGDGIMGSTQVAIAVTDNDEAPVDEPTVSAKTQEQVDAVFATAIADARTGSDWIEGGDAAMVDMSMLFNVAEGAMPAYSGVSSDEMVVSATASGMMLTLMPMSDGMATITVTASDSASGDVATAMSDVMVADLPFMVEMVSASAAMVEEGMSITISATANKMVEGDNVEVMLMRDGASTADDDDYSLDPPLITIMTGDDMGALTLMAEDDVDVEGMERLTLVAMMDGMNVGSVMIEIADNDMESTFTLSGPEDMNLVEGQSYELTVMADPAVAMDTEVMIMRDRSMSDADDADYTAEPVMINAGETVGTTMLMIEDDGPGDAGHGMPEMLVVFGMVDGMETNSLSFYTWDMAVPALPLIAQLLLAAFLAIGGYRRYLRR